MRMIFRPSSFLLFIFFVFQKNIFRASSKTLFNLPEGFIGRKFSNDSHLQKKIIIQSRLPHYFLAGDHIEIPVSIMNLTDSELTGQVQLQLFDNLTHQSVDGWFSNRQSNQYFTAGARNHATISFPIDVPYEYNRLLNYRLEASTSASTRNNPGEPAAGEHEEGLLPVLPNRMLISESIPLNMLQGGTGDFHFTDLVKNGNNESISQQSFKIEFAGNPVWYALQSLPYLGRLELECTDQIVDRLYANAAGISILNSSGQLGEIVEKWKPGNQGQLNESPQNSNLKRLLAEEIPWAPEPRDQNLETPLMAAFFDKNQLKEEMDQGLKKLESVQNPGGGFPWFKGGPDDRFITQYILINMGRIRKMPGIAPEYIERLNRLATKSIDRVDQMVKDDLIAEVKKNAHPGQIPLPPLQIQWLFMHSFFPEMVQSKQTSNFLEYIGKKAETAWSQQNKMLEAMLCIWMQRTGKKELARQVAESIKKNASHNKELGMFWKDLKSGIYWYQAIPETIVLTIEALWEINPDDQSINELKTWLITQKQLSHWATPGSTLVACHALLFLGENWQFNEPHLRIEIAGKEWPITSTRLQTPGYLSTTFFPPFIKPETGNIRVTLSPAMGEKKVSPAWGAAHWMFFDELNRGISTDGKPVPLLIKKKIFLKKNTTRGLQRMPIAENGELRPGDTVTIRMELVADRDLDFVQLKDQRAACMQALDTLSGFIRQGPLGYYKDHGDAGTRFFFSHLPKGSHAFEYNLVVEASGTYNCGMATAHFMYSGEYLNHIQGFKINVTEP